MPRCIVDEAFIEASIDYRYLLDRGYSQRSSLDLVVSRYGLSRRQRSLLYRCVHSYSYASRTRGKIVSGSMIEGDLLIIDLLNTLTTILATYMGECVYLCDDGVVRDVEGSRGWVRFDEHLVGLIDDIGSIITEYSPARVVGLIDRSVSWSGKILNLFLSSLGARGIDAEGKTCGKTDVEIMGLLDKYRGTSVVSTSDIVIIERADRIIDLPQIAIERARPENIDKTIYNALKELEDRGQVWPASRPASS